MLSFALQNFNIYQPFTVKTVRYLVFTRCLSTHLFRIFFKSNLIYGFYGPSFTLYNFNLEILNVFFYQRFHKPFWFFLKKFIFVHSGLYMNNISFSFIYHTLRHMNQLFNYSSYHIHHLFHDHHDNICYLSHPIRLLALSFHKKTFNTFIIFLFNLITDLYWVSTNFFKLLYSFIFFQPSHMLFFFWNKYYLKLRHF